MDVPAPNLDEKVVRQLRELADTQFTLRAFRDRWSAFGWSYDAHPDDRYGFRVRIDDQRLLMVSPVENDVVCASLPFLYWEDYEPNWHMDRSEYERQRAAFEAAFDAAATLARRVLPPPEREWTDADAQKHRAVIWSGTHGLLVLQQAAFDVQFGLELNFWLARRPAEGFRPTTPLIDWLCQLSRHDDGDSGFPPLAR